MLDKTQRLVCWVGLSFKEGAKTVGQGRGLRAQSGERGEQGEACAWVSSIKA